MKHFFSLLLLVTSITFGISPTVAASTVVKGEVLEVKEVPNYTYLLLKTGSGEVWTAVSAAPVKKGTTVSVENAEQMDNFESKALKKTFPIIFFGRLAAAAPGAAAAQASAAHTGVAKADFSGDVKVSKATGPQARTVAEIISQRAALKDKPVLLHARVVKYSASIMGKNWLHLRDGTGTAADDTHDLLATSGDAAKVGDVVLIKGTVRLDKDFGSGYAYKVLIEDAKLQK